MKFMSAVTGDERYIKISKQNDTEEVHTMCEVLDRVEKRGEVKGEERLSKLYFILIKEGKVSEFEKAAKDSEYRKKLFIQYGIE